MTHTASLRQRAGILTILLGMLLSLMAVVATPQPAFADGQGSPADCEMAGNADGGTATATGGQVISAICFKAGQIHSDVITSDGVVSGTYTQGQTAGTSYSYTVSGIGTASVTVTQSQGPGLSHVDYTLVEDEPEMVWVCRDGAATEIDAADLGDGETSYLSEDAASDDPDCVEDEPEMVWVCREGSVSEIDAADLGDGETSYLSEDAASSAAGCTPPPPPPPPPAELSADAVGICDTESIVASISEGADGEVEIVVNGFIVTRPVIGGEATISGLEIGATYPVTIRANGIVEFDGDVPISDDCEEVEGIVVTPPPTPEPPAPPVQPELPTVVEDVVIENPAPNPPAPVLAATGLGTAQGLALGMSLLLLGMALLGLPRRRQEL